MKSLENGEMTAMKTTTRARTNHGLGKSRLQAFKRILNRERNRALGRVREIRREEYEDFDFLPAAGDEMDVARSLGDAETHASLIERVEDRLKAIDDAFRRLEQGRYGVCEECGDEIPIERLDVMPFATYCVDCQRSVGNRRAAGTIEKRFAIRWTVPKEVDESLEEQDSLRSPEEELRVRPGAPFAREEEPEPIVPRVSPRRPRSRRRA
jgi:RNA polymerase-binding transcription factor